MSRSVICKYYFTLYGETGVSAGGLAPGRVVRCSARVRGRSAKPPPQPDRPAPPGWHGLAMLAQRRDVHRDGKRKALPCFLPRLSCSHATGKIRDESSKTRSVLHRFGNDKVFDHLPKSSLVKP